MLLSDKYVQTNTISSSLVSILPRKSRSIKTSYATTDHYVSLSELELRSRVNKLV